MYIFQISNKKFVLHYKVNSTNANVSACQSTVSSSVRIRHSMINVVTHLHTILLNININFHHYKMSIHKLALQTISYYIHNVFINARRDSASLFTIYFEESFLGSAVGIFVIIS